jgi:hypothetical protein
VLAVGLKQLGHAALGVRRDVHQLEQRQIAQPGTASNVALRKRIAVLYNEIRWASGSKSYNLLDFAHKWLAKN